MADKVMIWLCTSILQREEALYSDQIRAHYANPRNVGRVASPSAQAIVRSPMDSDTVLITLRIENNVIRDIRFKCMGCAVAIACSSLATEMVLGKHVDEAYQISKQGVANALGGIPEYKMLCSNLAPDAIRKAIDDWRAQSPNRP
ncbi:MAG TPA: iron-sulfur cluster assembly scaffold protein [Candidatus Angelobacter sp.]